MITDIFQLPQIILIILNTVFILWLGFLTFQMFSIKNHYNQLIASTQKKGLQEILEEILKTQNGQTDSIKELKKNLQEIDKNGSFHLQKIGFLRFNPFKDTGGDQSFILALLDEHKNGIVFSSLHSRDTTRVYAKQLLEGKCKEFPLSEEEQHVVHSAQALSS